MILSSDELEILEYLKGQNGNYTSVVEICRRAGGRQRYNESPHWAKSLLSRLVEGKLIEVNERGHYRKPVEEQPQAPTQSPAATPAASAPALVAENIFPGAAPAGQPASELLVDENYFAPPETEEDKKWVSPQIAEILKKSGKKFGSKNSDE